MGDLPTTLQMEISNEVNRVLIDHSPLFKGISGHPEATFEITSNLHRRVYLPGDFIIRRETLPQELFMLLKGRVKVSDQSGRDLAVLDEPHTFFGENALLHKTRTADCIALEYCDVLVLSLATYDRISRKYPQMRKVMTQLLEQESETRAVAARKMWAKAMDMSKRATRVSIRQRVASALQRGSIRSVSNSLRPKSSSPKANQVNPADNSARVAFEGEADAANRANLPAFLGERIPT
jgi:CRP-like cAMP-binding protein